MADRGYSLKAAWDKEVGRWYVAESDVPGLNTEGDTLDALIARAELIIPELLELNGLPKAF